MSLAKQSLPTDPNALRAFAASLQAELAARDSEVYEKALVIEKLRMELAVLRRARYGRSSERIEQLELLLSGLEEDGAENEALSGADGSGETTSPAQEAKAKRTPSVRTPLPSHLSRETVRHETACRCPCCGETDLSLVGEDKREVLEYVPSHFKVVVHVRPKMSCRACEKISQAPMPSLPIEKGRPGPGLLVAKYCDHTPLHRQSGIYGRSGVELERSTLANWVGKSAFLLRSLAEAIATHARAGQAVHADDTTVPVLSPGRKKTKTGRLWTLVRDERPWGSDAPPAALYHYSPDRRGEHAKTLLNGCGGYLHADGYAGFKQLYEQDPDSGEPPPFAEVACWAHARRKIFDVHAATQSAAARQILERMAALFAIEAEIRGQTPAHRLAIRQERSRPLLEKLKAFLDGTLAKISRKSSLAGAIRYSLTRWEAMARYATYGRLEMTNNAAERAIRPLALGRKNWIFAVPRRSSEDAYSGSCDGYREQPSQRALWTSWIFVMGLSNCC